MYGRGRAWRRFSALGFVVGVPRQSIGGWDSYLLTLGHITKPLAYDDVVWKTGRS